MPAGRSTAAREIAEYINTKWGISWVTPVIVQIFIVLSKPVREAIYAFLQTQIAALNVAKSKLVRESLKGNGLAEQINGLQVATALSLQPITLLLQTIPLDTIINELPDAQNFLGNSYKDLKEGFTFDKFMDGVSKISPDFAGFINELLSFVPVKIALGAISNTFGSNYEFFNGVQNFEDLRQRTEELEFRLARATALSSYAQAGSAFVDNQIDKIQVYLDIIVTINVGIL